MELPSEILKMVSEEFQAKAASTSDQDENPSVNASKHTICDPTGDRQIIAGKGGNAELFTVSSNAMSLACKPWNAMLGKDGRFVEASEHQTTPIPFPDDDVHALRILLNTVHLQFPSVPTKLTTAELRGVASLCDKYDCAKVVQPWLVHWIQEARRDDKAHNRTPHSHWCCISWVFGLKDTFKTVTEMVLEHTATSAGKVFLSPKGIPFRDGYLPLGVLDTILEARNTAIDKILEACYIACDRLAPGGKGFCRANSSDRFTALQRRKPCDALSYGALIFGLQELKLWPERKTSKGYELSLKELIEGVKKIETHRWRHHPAQYGDCELTGLHLKAGLVQYCDTALKDAKTKIEEKYRIQMTRQAEQCPIKACPSPSGSGAWTL